MCHRNIHAKIGNRIWKSNSAFSWLNLIKSLLYMTFIIWINMLLEIHYSIHFDMRTILNAFATIVRSNKSDFFFFTESAEDMFTLRKFDLIFQVWISHSSLVMRYVIVLSIYIHLLCDYISYLWSNYIIFLRILESSYLQLWTFILQKQTSVSLSLVRAIY